MISIVDYKFEDAKMQDRALSPEEVAAEVERRQKELRVGFRTIVGHTADGYPIQGTLWLEQEGRVLPACSSTIKYDPA